MGQVKDVEKTFVAIVAFNDPDFDPMWIMVALVYYLNILDSHRWAPDTVRTNHMTQGLREKGVKVRARG